MEQMPVFVKVESSGDFLAIINTLKTKIAEANETLGKIEYLSHEESMKISIWKSNFQTSNEKIKMISSMLLEPERV
jgi:hypothetical protein